MGEVFAGHYELVDLVGAGSSGAVWRAWDHRQQIYVCAKVMRQHDAAGLVRFVREHSESLRHPHVLLPRAWAGAEEHVLFAADLIRGGTVADLLAEHGPLPPFLVAQLADQVLSALTAVHARGQVHRDVRAGKLLLEPTGTERPHCWLGGFGAVTSGEPAEDLRQLGAVAAELCTALPSDPVTGPGPAPAQLPEPFWTWIRRMTGHTDQATAPFGGAEEARAELRATGLIPRSWPSTSPRVPDRLGTLPIGWAPDGPGAPPPAAADSSVVLDPTDSGTAGAYEEIPSLPHVVPPVASDLSDLDVPDDDGFAELAELLPSDPAYADSVPVQGFDEDRGPRVLQPPPDPEDDPADEPSDPPWVLPHGQHPYDPQGSDQSADQPFPEPSDPPYEPWPRQPDPVIDRFDHPAPTGEPAEPEQKPEPAELTNRAGFAPPAEPDDDAEEFQSRPTRVRHPFRRTRQPGLEAPGPVPSPGDDTGQVTGEDPGQGVDQDASRSAVWSDRTVAAGTEAWPPSLAPDGQPAPSQPDLPAARAQAAGAQGAGAQGAGAQDAGAQDADRPGSDPYAPADISSEPPSPRTGPPRPGAWHTGEWVTGEWPVRERTDADEGNPVGPSEPVRGEPTYYRPGHPESPAPDLPPLDLDEPEPSRWRRVLLVGFAIVALVGALVGTWYLVMRYQ